MDLELIERQLVYRGRKISLEVHHFLNREDGSRIAREVCVHPGAVVVLAVLPDDRVVLIRNRRFAVSQYLLELPAGTLEPSEPPINCAGRELLEETGYLAGRMTPLATFFTSPGVLTERMHAFVATQLEQGTPALKDDEEIEVRPVPMRQALAMIETGEIQDAKTIAVLLMYQRMRQNG
jgi:ADP-ribose pyrophosphatase